jgi:hypothetical protein
VRRNFVRRTAGFRRQTALQLQAQLMQLLLQHGDFMLLPGDSTIQFFQQVFAETELDFDFGKTCIHDNLALLRQHDDLDTLALDGLPGADFSGLAAFRLAIDSNLAVSHHMFTLPATFGNAGNFEQVTQPDMFVLELELADFHGIPVSLRQEHDTG